MRKEKEEAMEKQEVKWIGFELKAVNNLIRRNLDVRFAEAGLDEVSGMQGPILGFVQGKSREKDVFQRDVEKEFNIRRSTATVMLQNLEQKGLIIREPVDHDGRLKKIVITPKAEKYQMIIRKQIDIFNEDLEEGLTAGERGEFLRILGKIEANLQKGISGGKRCSER